MRGPLAVIPRGRHALAGQPRVGRCIWAVPYNGIAFMIMELRISVDIAIYEVSCLLLINLHVHMLPYSYTMSFQKEGLNSMLRISLISLIFIACTYV